MRQNFILNWFFFVIGSFFNLVWILYIIFLKVHHYTSQQKWTLVWLLFLSERFPVIAQNLNAKYTKCFVCYAKLMLRKIVNLINFYLHSPAWPQRFAVIFVELVTIPEWIDSTAVAYYPNYQLPKLSTFVHFLHF